MFVGKNEAPRCCNSQMHCRSMSLMFLRLRSPVYATCTASYTVSHRTAKEASRMMTHSF